MSRRKRLQALDATFRQTAQRSRQSPRKLAIPTRARAHRLRFEQLERRALLAVVADSFEAPHDFAGGDVGGTIWDGVLNPDHLAVGQTDGWLTWAATVNSGWEGTLDNGPVLYKNVAGDFDVTVEVKSMTGVLYSDGGLMVRAPGDGTAGAGEDYVALRYFGAGGGAFNSTRSTDDGVTTNRDYGSLEPDLRIVRHGSVFTLYTRPDTNSDWKVGDRFSRPDLDGLPALQVGLWFGTFMSGETGQAQFDNFELKTGDDVPPAAQVSPIAVPLSQLAVATPTPAFSADIVGLRTDLTYTAIWDWGDGQSSLGALSETGGTGSVTDTHIYATPGVYQATLRLVDSTGDWSESTSQSFTVAATTTTTDPTGSLAATLIQDINSVPVPLASNGAPYVWNGSVYFDGPDNHLWRTDGTASGTAMVSPIESVSGFAAMGNSLYFTAYDVSSGVELWKLDGATGSVSLVQDVNPGPDSSDPQELTACGDVLYFRAHTPDNGVELWRSDGTGQGTYVVRDINPAGDANPAELTVMGNRLYFRADDGTTGSEVWATDGTSQGTVLVADLAPGADGANPQRLTAFGSTLYFSVNNPQNGSDWWQTDGTAEGTRLFHTGGWTNPVSLARVGDQLYFTSDDGAGGFHLSTSDLTGHTTFITDVNPSGGGAFFPHLIGARSKLYFEVYDNHGWELWTSDGTSAGTSAVASIASSHYPVGGMRYATVGDTLYWQSDDGYANFQLWTSDGTTSGTKLLGNIGDLGYSGDTWNTEPSNLVPFNDQVVFTSGYTLWSSGTSAVPLHPFGIPGRTADANPTYLTSIGPNLFFVADDGRQGRSLWVTDGTAAGTHNLSPLGTTDPDWLTAVGSWLYFTVNDPRLGVQLWRTDGTTTGTTLVTGPTVEGAGLTGFRALAGVGNMLYFAGYDSVHGSELWRSDGTPGGTSLIMDINPTGNSGPFQITYCGNSLFFFADDGVHGQELWRSDSTPGGTFLLKDLNPGPGGSRFWEDGATTCAGNRLYFSAADPTHGTQMWTSDGTDTGTHMLDSPLMNHNDRGFPDLVVAGGLTYYSINDYYPGHSPWTIWRTDGTDAGTIPLATSGGRITAVGNLAYFVTSSTASGTELARSDGTPDGTFILKDINPGPTGADPRDLVNVNGRLFFTADDGVHGRQLWSTDGTLAGTVAMANEVGSGPAVTNGAMYFVRNDLATGNELWALNAIEGTAGDDVISIDPGPSPGTIVATVNGVAQPALHVPALVVRGLAGNDQIVINAGVAQGVFVDGGAGVDHVTVAVGSLAGPVDVQDTGNPTDDNQLSVLGTAANDYFQVQPGMVTWLGPQAQSVKYGNHVRVVTNELYVTTPPNGGTQGTPLALTGSFTNQQGSLGAPYNYTWIVTDATGSVVAAAYGSFAAYPSPMPDFTFTPQGSGRFVATLRVEDQTGRAGQVRTAFDVAQAKPTANAGGPYVVSEGLAGVLMLDGSRSSSPSQPSSSLKYQWDLDGDGLFGEPNTAETGGAMPQIWLPQFGSRVYDGPATIPIALKVTDSSGAFDISTTNIVIANVAPDLSVSSDSPVAPGSPVTIITSANDPANNTPYGRLDPLLYAFDFDNDGVYEVSGFNSLATHTFTQPGSYPVNVRVSDGDGGVTVRSTTVSVAPVVSFSTTALSVPESQGSVTVTATLSSPLLYAVQIPLSTSGTALNGGDYSLTSNTIVIPPGQLRGSVDIRISNDQVYELADTVILTMAQPTSPVLAKSSPFTLTITDDDPPPIVSLDPDPVTHQFFRTSNESPSTSYEVISAHLSAASQVYTAVPLTFGGSATLGSDYAVRNNATELVFPPGSTTASISLSIVDDDIPESPETISVGIAPPSVTSPYHTQPTSAQSFVLSIPANDYPSVTLASPSLQAVSELDVENPVPITARLSAAQPVDVSIPIRARNSSDPTGGDIRLSSTTLVIPAGQLTGQVTLYIEPDNLGEPDEYVDVSLGTPINAILASPTTATVRILANDTPTLSFATTPNTSTVTYVNSPATGTISATAYEDAGVIFVPLTLSNPLEQDLQGTLHWYGSYSDNVPFYIGKGSTFGYVLVSTHNDTVSGNSATLSAGGIVTSALVTWTSTGYRNFIAHILDDDPTVTFHTGTEPFLEGTKSNQVPLTVELSALTNKDVTVTFAKPTGTASLGKSLDYTLPATASVVIKTGQKTADYIVTVNDDSLDEPVETVGVSIASVTNALLGATHTNTLSIQDNDSPPGLSIHDTSVKEGTGKNSTMTFTVTVPAPSGQTISVNYTTGKGTAVPGSDYTATSGTLTFAPGEIKKTISVPVIGDSAYEGNEYFYVYLSRATNASLATSQGKGTITDDDPAPAVKTTTVQPTTTSTTAAVTSQPTMAQVGVLGVTTSPATGLTVPTSIGQSLPGDSLISGIPLIGTLQKGYIDGSIVFFDSNRDGQFDFLDLNGNGEQDADEPTEPVAVSGLDGRFELTVPSDFDRNGDGVIDPSEGTLVALGGTDTATGLPLTLSLAAAPGDFVVGPLSTLRAALVYEQGLSLAEADLRVKAALGLPNIDLSRLDVLAAAVDGDFNAAQVFATDAQLLDTMAQATTIISHATAAPPQFFIQSVMLSVLAKAIGPPDSFLDLREPSVVRTLLDSVLWETGTQLSADVIAGMSQAIAAGNQHIGQALLDPTSDYLTSIVQTQVVAQAAVADQLAAVAAGEEDVAALLDNTMGDALATLIQAAPIGQLIPPAISISDVRQIEGDHGDVYAELSVTLDRSSSLPIGVSFQTLDGSATAGDDYDAVSGTLTWGPNDTTARTIRVPIHGDSTFESDETVRVALSGESNAVLYNAVGVATILNDDSLTYDAPGDSGPNELYLSYRDGALTLVRNEDVLLTAELSTPVSVSIAGANGVANSLDIDLQDSTIVGRIDFQGGDQPTDMLRVEDGTAALADHLQSTLDSGEFSIDSAVVTYARVEDVSDRTTAVIQGIPAGVADGSPLAFAALLSSPEAADAYSYHWQVTRDGLPYDSSTARAWAFSPDEGHYTVQLIIDADFGGVGTTRASFTVANRAPVAVIAGPVTAVRGQELLFGLSASDTPLDSQHGFVFRVNWGDESPEQLVDATPNNGTGVNLAHTFAVTGQYDVTVVALDQHGAASAAAQETVSIVVTALEADPLSPGQQMLVVGGGRGDDKLRIVGEDQSDGDGSSAVYLRISVNQRDEPSHKVRGTLAEPISRIVVFAQAGNDDVAIDGDVSIPAWLYGGDGNDRLRGGQATNVLMGGNGDDLLVGSTGRDFLIGGAGADRLVGNADDDILVAGTTAFDQRDLALNLLLAEWNSNRQYAERIANLRAGAGLASGYCLVGDDGPNQTVFNDGSVDVLTGGEGSDWFLANRIADNGGPLDQVTDKSARELWDDVDF